MIIIKDYIFATIIGTDYVGAWELRPPLGSATRGLSPSENCEKKHFLVVKVIETQDNNARLTLLL